ncbi:pseudouridine synthase [Filimonas effusa]
MLSQFIGTDKGRMLGELNYPFPEGTHAIGRLDYESEGLLLLTTNKKVTRLLFQGEVPHKRSYLVQVRGIVTEETLLQLQSGIAIRVKGGVDYTTAPCQVQLAQAPQGLPELPHDLNPYVKSSWLRIVLTEGKFHQVRKMVRSVNHRCLRLVRVAIEDIDLDLQNQPPGTVREIEESAFFSQLCINNW